VIFPCQCSHEYQDKLYGKGRRVWNGMGLLGKSGIRCTVCGAENKNVVVKEEKKKEDK
jgi:hypothetical protein